MCCLRQPESYTEDPKRVELMASGCLCLGGTYAKAQECLGSSVSSGFCPGFGRSLCAWLLDHRRRGSWKSSAISSCTDSLIFLRSCPFCGHLHPDAAELVHSLCVASACSFKASGSQWAWQCGRMRMGWLQKQEGTWPAAHKRFCYSVQRCDYWSLHHCHEHSATAITPLTADGCPVLHHQNPWTCPIWYHPHWLSITLLAPWHPLGLCPWVLFARLSHNQRVHEKGNEVRMLVGLLSLSLLPR